MVDFGILALALARSLRRRGVVRGWYVSRDLDPGPKTTSAGRARRAWLAAI